MKALCCAVLLIATVPLRAACQDLNGTWIAVFTGPVGERPKMFDEVVLRLKPQGMTLAGAAHMSSWPGDAALTEGRIHGDTVFFTFVGKLPSSGGFPIIRFTGTFTGGSPMKLTMNWGDTPKEMIATRLSD